MSSSNKLKKVPERRSFFGFVSNVLLQLFPPPSEIWYNVKTSHLFLYIRTFVYIAVTVSGYAASMYLTNALLQGVPEHVRPDLSVSVKRWVGVLLGALPAFTAHARYINTTYAENAENAFNRQREIERNKQEVKNRQRRLTWGF
jgi:hypothetical protein